MPVCWFAHRRHAERSKKLDGDGGAQWIRAMAAREQSHQTGGDPEPEKAGTSAGDAVGAAGVASARKINDAAVNLSQAVPAGPTRSINGSTTLSRTKNIAATASVHAGTGSSRESVP